MAELPTVNPNVYVVLPKILFDPEVKMLVDVDVDVDRVCVAEGRGG